MTQFIVLIFGLGIAVPALHARGMNSVLLALATAGALIAIHFLIAVVGRFLPVRCKYCLWPSHYRGFGWWPFTYRYACGHCGQEMRFEVTG
jgi:hypothetical protein